MLGQRVFGFVTLASGTNETVVAEILQGVAKRLASYKVPEDIYVLDALPRNALGKVDRNLLQAMICEDGGTLLPPHSAPLPVRRIA